VPDFLQYICEWLETSSQGEKSRKAQNNKRTMKNKPQKITQTTTTIMTRLRWGAFLLVFLFLVIQVIPRALGQRDASKRSSDVEIPLLKQRPAALEPGSKSVPHLDGGTWTVTGNLNTARVYHTATMLLNGMALVTGGYDTLNPLHASASAELYDPASGTWTATGSLNTGRGEYTATLQSNGMALVAGGSDGSSILASAELYDPASRTWTPTCSLNTARADHTATLLPNGMTLVAGGFDGSSILASAELSDGCWTFTGNLNTARADHTATWLPNNGMVLVAGGYDSSFNPSVSAELYDPASGTWTAATASLNTARAEHTATLLSNGMALVAGGFDDTGNASASAELYDPASRTWTPTGSLNSARARHTATLLPNGTVLISGGFNNGALTDAELYDPASRTWTVTGSLNSARRNHTATLLPNGMVLAAGGLHFDSILASAELYTQRVAPRPRPTPHPRPTPR
jgi:Galactose oxidase, central domain/Kelch motif